MAGVEKGLDRLLDGEKPLVGEIGQEALKGILHHARKLTRARYADITQNPDGYGLLPGHPEMRSFLGVPIVIHQRVWGNLYLAEKGNNEHFTVGDVETATALAGWAATAIESARSDGRSEVISTQPGRRGGLGARSSRAPGDVTDAFGGGAELEGRLEFIVKRGRDLVGAHSTMIMLREADELLVVACAGLAQAARGRRFPIAGSLSGRVLERSEPHQVTDVATELQIDPAAFGLADAQAGLLVPMVHGGIGIGIFAAFDQGAHDGEFSDEDVGLLRALAQATANAVVI
jgi:GAF domain-containing protein